ncbi:MAG TPA: NAD-dependent epimerase/dehydratase family protein [Gemmatimonadaceae bacterium]|nr:NAD-dependent epimerase/dehydratase family protein [Gemmatimonadaceae bacterium]
MTAADRNDREIRPRVRREPADSGDGRPVLITGGAGFIGSNVADRLLGDRRDVIVFDNLSREGVERNLTSLRARHGDRLIVQIGDVRDRRALTRAVALAGEIYHFAAQVAVTTALLDPAEDFEINALGTLNLLEAMRGIEHSPTLLFTSTNKVYGPLGDIPVKRSGDRYVPRDRAIRSAGIGEDRPLEFHSPYGCSKGTADQYVLDYARSYGLPAAVFRMSCVYGPRQCGTEDQGWVAHFLMRALDGRPITLFGDGRQVRDILYVDDLVEACLIAQRKMGALSGTAFNIGGGPGNTTSLLELVDRIARLCRRRPEVSFEPWRIGDQRYYVSDITRFASSTGWAPKVSVEVGLGRLHAWLVGARGEPRTWPAIGTGGPLVEEAGVAAAEELA